MVTTRVGGDEIEVSLLGSYGIEQAWLTLDLLVRAWEAGRSADASVELLR
jgi:predicted small integral membrane protein